MSNERSIKIKDNCEYQITFEWVRENRVVTTEWLGAEDTKGLIALCNLNPIQVHEIEERAA